MKIIARLFVALTLLAGAPLALAQTEINELTQARLPLDGSELVELDQGLCNFCTRKATLSQIKTFIGTAAGCGISDLIDEEVLYVNGGACAGSAAFTFDGTRTVSLNDTGVAPPSFIGGGRLVIEGTQGGTPAADAGPKAIISGFTSGSFGGEPSIGFSAASGTPGTPAALHDALIASPVLTFVYNGTNYQGPLGAVARIDVWNDTAGGTFSGTDMGTGICLATTGRGNTNLHLDAFCVDDDRGVLVGGNAFAGVPEGYGTINTHGYWIDNHPLACADLAGASCSSFGVTPTIVQSASTRVAPGNPPSGTVTFASPPTPGNLLLFLTDVPDSAGSVFDPNGWTFPSGVIPIRYSVLAYAITNSHPPLVLARVAQVADPSAYTFTFNDINNAVGGASSLLIALEIANAGEVKLDSYVNNDITGPQFTNPLPTYISGANSLSRNALGLILSSVSYDATAGTQSASVVDATGAWSTVVTDLDNTNLDYRYLFSRSALKTATPVVSWANLTGTSPSNYPTNTAIVIEAVP